MYFADFHVHSKYSIATAKNCDLPELARSACRKGITVVATGDFTHPKWNEEIKAQLEEDGTGLFRLKNSLSIQGLDSEKIRFILNVEISSIYKRDGCVRKVHNLVFMPDFKSMDSFNARLDKIGNIKSDGRPILGLDSRNLLEIALESSPEAFLIPAHIWTPWFSVLGSKSGFNSVDECFADLSDHIFALETGLSSDPEMNYMVSSLDRYTLISNSDIHSPGKLGRECNIFSGKPGYLEIRNALKSGPLKNVVDGNSESGWFVSGTNDGFVGTIEFFPEEGKYHLDGHRKCRQRLLPEDTEKHKGRCPVCGGIITVGVVNRVEALADRQKGVHPEKSAPFWRMIPLIEIVAEAFQVGVNTKKTTELYETCLNFGSEFGILWEQPLDILEKNLPPLVVEGIRRVRSGNVNIHPGYDGEYGVIEIFGEGEREALMGQHSFVVPESMTINRKSAKIKNQAAGGMPQQKKDIEPDQLPAGLDKDQLKAAECSSGPVLIKAGPGTGKTRTLCHRMRHLIQKASVDPISITAVTFTRKSAQEIRSRLDQMVSPEVAQKVWIGTFHQLGMRIVQFFADRGFCGPILEILDEAGSYEIFHEACKRIDIKPKTSSMRQLFRQIDLIKQKSASDQESVDYSELSSIFSVYQGLLTEKQAVDYNDLLLKPLQLLRNHSDVGVRFAQEYCRHLLIDEFQDINELQYQLTEILIHSSPEGLFAIGDPDQCIYGFRGSKPEYFQKFGESYPSVKQFNLSKNYRSTAKIIQLAGSCFGRNDVKTVHKGGSRVQIVPLQSWRDEADHIGATIEKLMGGISFYSSDSGKVEEMDSAFGFKDFAVLYRTNAIGDTLEQALEQTNLPIQRARKSDPKEEAESLRFDVDAVPLMTMHASKGLEFPVVFIVGCEDSIIPFTGSVDTDLDEELRLFYVAVTRASRLLFISHVRSRVYRGRRMELEPSRFFEKFPKSSCDYLKMPGKRKRELQTKLFE